MRKNNKTILTFLLALTLWLPVSGQLFANETQRVYLSGTGNDDTVAWEFYCTDGRRSGEWTTINVPSCWEQEGFGTYNYGVNFYGKATDPLIPNEEGKYRHRFDVPADWQGQRVVIVFEGVMTDAEVRINGKKAGPTHQGAFYRFSYDLTNYILFGEENQLDVWVKKESDNPSVNLAERRADYWNFGGIFRPVYLEIHPPLFIRRNAIAAEADGSFLAEVYLSEGQEGDYEVKAEVFDAKGKAVGKALSSKLRPGSDQVLIQGGFEKVALWNAETPNLYEVRFSLVHQGEVLHQVKERFGFRTFEVREKDGLYVNGQLVKLRGVNRHAFWPETGRTINREIDFEDVRMMKDMNMNAIRVAHYPPDKSFLEACDELGLYVINELGGWHGRYDTGVGRKLVKEMVTRDVNHPSILFWANGNEGGWNVELDNDYALWDPQNRPVLHPQQYLNGVETMHYRSYGQVQEYLRGEHLYMPTEFLHGLYDGGHGAGLYDYWEMMYNHPNCAGGFLWVFADEGVVRTDQNGRIDNDGNHGADGIVGPHREKEGSYFTIKQVWSPVQLRPEVLPVDFTGELTVENRYDFTNLKDCSFSFRLAGYADVFSGERRETTLARGAIKSPDVAPHQKGALQLSLPSDWREANVLFVTVNDPSGKELWTWSYDLEPVRYQYAGRAASRGTVRELPRVLEVVSGKLTVSFDKESGLLSQVVQNGKTISFANGPRFIGARRGDRSLDRWMEENLPANVDRIYPEIQDRMVLTQMDWTYDADTVVVEMSYSGLVEKVQWRIYPDETLQLNYAYRYDGVVELMGVRFDYPEVKMEGIEFLGYGPYRVWQNRERGTSLGIWSNDYNDPIPGETFIYPEFKGYFRNWQWAEFSTAEGRILVNNNGNTKYLGVYTPRDGRDKLLYTLPESGLSFLDVIPAVRNKVNTTDLIGPSSQAVDASGVYKGSLWLKFETE